MNGGKVVSNSCFSFSFRFGLQISLARERGDHFNLRSFDKPSNGCSFFTVTAV